jgi:N utilization substance protein B
LSRRKAREYAFKVVFQVDQVKADPRKAFDYLLENQLTDSDLPENKLTEKECSFSWQLIEGTLQYMAAIDEKIARYSRDWSVERMSSVDRNLMRVAGFEIMYLPGAEPVIAIDEAVEIAKKYGEENSSAFVNAILDRIQGDRDESVSGD